MRTEVQSILQEGVLTGTSGWRRPLFIPKEGLPIGPLAFPHPNESQISTERHLYVHRMTLELFGILKVLKKL